ncbi:Hypothetical predicted protein, partial [Mytilus galloprovincialis]
TQSSLTGNNSFIEALKRFNIVFPSNVFLSKGILTFRIQNMVFKVSRPTSLSTSYCINYLSFDNINLHVRYFPSCFNNSNHEKFYQSGLLVLSLLTYGRTTKLLRSLRHASALWSMRLGTRQESYYTESWGVPRHSKIPILLLREKNENNASEILHRLSSHFYTICFIDTFQMQLIITLHEPVIQLLSRQTANFSHPDYAHIIDVDRQFSGEPATLEEDAVTTIKTVDDITIVDFR